jgi:hypothetical protein
MNLAALLTELEQRGITVEPLPDGNLYVFPRDVLAPELRERLKAEKPALIAYLRTRELALEAERQGLGLVQYIAQPGPDIQDTSGPVISTADAILATCRQLGIVIHLNDGGLVISRSDPSGKEPGIPCFLARAVARHFGEIVAQLRHSGHHKTRRHIGTIYRGQSSTNHDRFGSCKICHEPTDLITPDGEQFCGDCWRQSTQQSRPRRMRSRRSEEHGCPICRGEWNPGARFQSKPSDAWLTAASSDEWLAAVTSRPPCTALDERDVTHCHKFYWLYREVDRDELALSYPAGPFSRWPQSSFQKAPRKSTRGAAQPAIREQDAFTMFQLIRPLASKEKGSE